jgi:hypothetical protein
MAALDRTHLGSALMATECAGQNVWLAEIK